MILQCANLSRFKEKFDINMTPETDPDPVQKEERENPAEPRGHRATGLLAILALMTVNFDNSM